MCVFCSQVFACWCHGGVHSVLLMEDSTSLVSAATVSHDGGPCQWMLPQYHSGPPTLVLILHGTLALHGVFSPDTFVTNGFVVVVFVSVKCISDPVAGARP